MRDFLKNFPTETVRIVDENENEIVTVEGLFSDKGMSTTNVSTPIYEGQLIIRTLPNGLNEKYKIINSKYVKGMHDICDSYMLTLQKENVPKEKNITRSTITNNIYSCDKVNIDSIDNSVNIYINDNENEKINEIRNIITNLEGNSRRTVYYLHLVKLLMQVVLPHQHLRCHRTANVSAGHSKKLMQNFRTSW